MVFHVLFYTESQLQTRL